MTLILSFFKPVRFHSEFYLNYIFTNTIRKSEVKLINRFNLLLTIIYSQGIIHYNILITKLTTMINQLVTLQYQRLPQNILIATMHYSNSQNNLIIR